MNCHSTKQIVFIPGTFISHTCWDEWMPFFEKHGYKCVAPAWPFKNAASEDLRNREVKDLLAYNTIESVTNHFSTFITDFAEKPILIGHSLGGLIVQLLLQKKQASLGVAIHSFPFHHNIRFSISWLSLFWKTILNPAFDIDVCLVSFRKWRFAFTNGLHCDLQKDLYYKYAIPESKRIIRELFNSFRKNIPVSCKVPLLLTGGAQDKLVPSKVNYANYEKYAQSEFVVEFKEFKNHPHIIFGQEAGRKEARYILNWLKRQQSF